MIAAEAVVAGAVETLRDKMARIMADCTDAEGRDLGELLRLVREGRYALYAIECDVEAAAAKAMLGDFAEGPGIRMERSRAPERKEWDHEAWQADVRAKVLQAHGLKGAQGVVTASGEVAEVSLAELLREVEGIHGAGQPRTTGLRKLGLDPDDYCARTTGTWRVKVTRLAREGDA